MSGEGAETPEKRLERELAYYRGQVNSLGAQIIRMREEQHQTFLDAQRSRVVVNMVRELYRIHDRPDVTVASLTGRVLEIVAASAMCTCAALFREGERGDDAFALVDAVGLPPAERPKTLRLHRPPPFLFTTAKAPPEPSAQVIAKSLDAPYILWSYDSGSGFALALANRSETNASRPFELADQELIETALTVYLDARLRVSQRSSGFDGGKGDAEDVAGEQSGVEGGDALKQHLRRGGRIVGVLVVERPSGEGTGYATYLKVTWKSGWQVLRSYRDRDDRTYRKLNVLMEMLRDDLGYTGPVTIHAPGAPELGRFPGIAARERGRRDRANARSDDGSADAPNEDIESGA